MTDFDLNVLCGIFSVLTAQALWSLVAYLIHGFFFSFSRYMFYNGLVRRRIDTLLVTTQCSRHDDDESAASATRSRTLLFLSPRPRQRVQMDGGHISLRFSTGSEHYPLFYHVFLSFYSLDTILDGIPCVCARCTYRPGIGTVYWYLDRSGKQSLHCLHSGAPHLRQQVRFSAEA